MALRVVFLLCLLMHAWGSPVQADESVKQAIFEDCEQAIKDMSTQTVEEQTSLADFLARVVALSTQSPTAPEAFAVAPGTSAAGDAAKLAAPRSPELIPGALWQTLDAKRELKAKRCALELLRNAGGLALHVLPNLVSTYAEQALSDEISVGLEETVADIAERAHKQGLTPSSEQMGAIAAHVFGQRPLAARSVIQEYLPEGLPHVLRALPRSTATIAEIAEYIGDADPGGAFTMRACIALTATLSPDEIAPIIARISLPDAVHLTSFIHDFIRLAADQRFSKIFLPLLGQACTTLDGFTVDAAQQNLLATIPDSMMSSLLSAEQFGCITSSAPALIKHILSSLAKDSPVESQRRALNILASKYARFSTESRAELCAKVRERALDIQSDVALDATQTLARLEYCKAESSQTALTIVKNSPSISDIGRRDLFLSTVIALLDTTGLGKEPNRFAPFIKPYLSSPSPPPAALRLASKIPQLEAQLLSLALAVPPSPKSVAALGAISTNPTLLKRSSAQLIELLRYPETQILAEKALASLGTTATGPLRKAMARPGWAARSSALAALLGTQSASKVESTELAMALATREGCSFVSTHSATLCALAQNPASDTSLKAHVVSAVHRCLNEMQPHQLAEIVRCAPDVVLSASDVINSFLTTHGDNERFNPVVALLSKQATPSVNELKLITAFLEYGSQETQSILIPIVSNLAADSPEISRAVRTITQRTSPDNPLQRRALRALAARGDTEYPWKDFVREAIRANGKLGIQPGMLEIISVIPAVTVLSEVLPALESESQEKLVGGALVGASLGPKAIPIVSRLWHLREARSPLVKYTAILALLQINPLTPDVHHEVAKILVNRYFPIALQLPIKWSHTVAVVDMDRGAFGSLRKERLERLLRSER